MVYVTKEEVLNYINFDREDLNFNSDTEFHSFLEDVEKQARSMIENIKDAGFEFETIQEVTSAPESSTVTLKYPVKTVNKLEYRISPSDTWKTVNEDNYAHDEFKIYLTMNVTYPHNPPYFNKRKSWSWQDNKPTFPPIRGTIRVDYDRGWESPSWDGSGTDNIPGFLKNACLKMISNILIAKKTNQIATITNIENPETLQKLHTIIDEEIKDQIEDEMPDTRGQGGVI